MGGGGPSSSEKARLKALQALQGAQAQQLRQKELEAKRTKAAQRRARVAAQQGSSAGSGVKRTLG